MLRTELPKVKTNNYIDRRIARINKNQNNAGITLYLFGFDLSFAILNAIKYRKKTIHVGWIKR